MQDVTEEKLKDLFNNDQKLALFFVTWLQCGLNATQAYLEINPQVSRHSASTLGARMLAKVGIPEILSAYGLGYETYFQQLKNGLTAEVNGTPDNRTRRQYHHVLGVILGFETNGLRERVLQPQYEVTLPDWYTQTRDAIRTQEELKYGSQ